MAFSADVGLIEFVDEFVIKKSEFVLFDSTHGKNREFKRRQSILFLLARNVATFKTAWVLCFMANFFYNIIEIINDDLESLGRHKNTSHRFASCRPSSYIGHLTSGWGGKFQQKEKSHKWNERKVIDDSFPYWQSYDYYRSLLSDRRISKTFDMPVGIWKTYTAVFLWLNNFTHLFLHWFIRLNYNFHLLVQRETLSLIFIQICQILKNFLLSLKSLLHKSSKCIIYNVELGYYFRKSRRKFKNIFPFTLSVFCFPNPHAPYQSHFSHKLHDDMIIFIIVSNYYESFTNNRYYILSFSYNSIL